MHAARRTIALVLTLMLVFAAPVQYVAAAPVGEPAPVAPVAVNDHAFHDHAGHDHHSGHEQAHQHHAADDLANACPCAGDCDGSCSLCAHCHPGLTGHADALPGALSATIPSSFPTLGEHVPGGELRPPRNLHS